MYHKLAPLNCAYDLQDNNPCIDNFKSKSKHIVIINNTLANNAHTLECLLLRDTKHKKHLLAILMHM